MKRFIYQYAFLVFFIALGIGLPSVVVAKDAGSLCVMKTAEAKSFDESGAFRRGSGGSPNKVLVQLNKGQKVPVSPLEYAYFSDIDFQDRNVVSVFSRDGEKRLLSFRLEISSDDPNLCMFRQPVYGTWSVREQDEKCICE